MTDQMIFPRRTVVISLLVSLLLGCAAEIVRYPASLNRSDVAEVRQVQQGASLTLSSGYSRHLNQSSKWKKVGGITQGTVYSPVDTTFAIEGAQVHEAYLVVQTGKLVGFYLPVEKSFSPLRSDQIVKIWD